MPTLMLKESLISFDSPVERYTVPPMIRRIAANAFYDKGRLVHLTIPDNVVEIGDFAFKMCFNMNRLDLPARVEKFGIGMFQQCRKLEVVVLPEGVREIDPGMFVCCDSLRSVTIPQSVEKISPHAFTTSHELREIVIPPENLHLLPESRRSIAAITYMKRHISDGGSSVIDAFVRQDPGRDRDAGGPAERKGRDPLHDGAPAPEQRGDRCARDEGQRPQADGDRGDAPRSKPPAGRDRAGGGTV